MKPGCTAADESGLVHYHLVGLAEGRGGFGLLRESRRRLDRAVKGAAMMGDKETAGRLQVIAEKLPEVRDPEAAGRLASELEPLLPVTWELGKRCGGTAITPEMLDRVKKLSLDIKEGRISQQDAIKELQEGFRRA